VVRQAQGERFWIPLVVSLSNHDCRYRAFPPEADVPLAQALSRADLKLGPYGLVDSL